MHTRVRMAAVAGLAVLGLAIGAAFASAPYRAKAIVLMPHGMTHTGRYFEAAQLSGGPVINNAARLLRLNGPGALRDRISVTLPARATASGRLAVEITASGATRTSASTTVTTVATSFMGYLVTWGRTALGRHRIRNVSMLGRPVPLPCGSWLQAAVRPAVAGLLSGLALGLLLLLMSGRAKRLGSRPTLLAHP